MIIQFDYTDCADCAQIEKGWDRVAKKCSGDFGIIIIV
jgi:hypothetical protein